jgi:hypothetical protein
MIYHPLLALSKIKGLTEVVIIGFYEDSLFADFIKQAKREFPGLSITYVPLCSLRLTSHRPYRILSAATTYTIRSVGEKTLES